MSGPRFEITKAAGFDAAHRLPGGAGGDLGEGRYTRLHGHSFRVEATLSGEATAPAGWVEDLALLDEALRAAAGALDHSLLNDHPGLENPTLEALCLYFAARLQPHFPALSRVAVSRPSLSETCAFACGAVSGNPPAPPRRRPGPGRAVPARRRSPPRPAPPK